MRSAPRPSMLLCLPSHNKTECFENMLQVRWSGRCAGSQYYWWRAHHPQLHARLPNLRMPLVPTKRFLWRPRSVSGAQLPDVGGGREVLTSSATSSTKAHNTGRQGCAESLATPATSLDLRLHACWRATPRRLTWAQAPAAVAMRRVGHVSTLRKWVNEYAPACMSQCSGRSGCAQSRQSYRRGSNAPAMRHAPFNNVTSKRW